MEPRFGDILGANPLSTGECHFLVWAPHAESVKLQILAPFRRSLPMQPLPKGYFRAAVEDAASCRYLYDLGGNGRKNEGRSGLTFPTRGSPRPLGSAVWKRVSIGRTRAGVAYRFQSWFSMRFMWGPSLPRAHLTPSSPGSATSGTWESRPSSSCPCHNFLAREIGDTTAFSRFRCKIPTAAPSD